MADDKKEVGEPARRIALRPESTFQRWSLRSEMKANFHFQRKNTAQM